MRICRKTCKRYDLGKTNCKIHNNIIIINNILLMWWKKNSIWKNWVLNAMIYQHQLVDHSFTCFSSNFHHLTMVNARIYQNSAFNNITYIMIWIKNIIKYLFHINFSHLVRHPFESIKYERHPNFPLNPYPHVCTPSDMNWLTKLQHHYVGLFL